MNALSTMKFSLTERINYRCFMIAFLLHHVRIVKGGWYGGDSGNSNIDQSLYTTGGSIGWSQGYSSLSMSVHGCVYAQVNDLDDMGCIGKGSEDGTYYWYQMVNCRRAQVAYTVYASNNNNAQCKKDYYIETLATLGGVGSFLETLEAFGDDKYADSNYVSNYGTCEEDGNGYYQGLACSEDGSFVLAKFYDQYCLSYDSTVKTLNDLTYALQKYNCYDCSDGLCANLASYSDSCSPNDYPVCEDVYGTKVNAYKSVSQQTGAITSAVHNTSQVSSLPTKLKYTAGSLLLISSFIMFLGILSTSRRKRRTALQRKYRTSTSRSYDEDGATRRRRSSSRARSQSRHRSSKEREVESSAKDRTRSRSRGRVEKEKSSKYRSSSRKHRDRKDPDGTWA